MEKSYKKSIGLIILIMLLVMAVFYVFIANYFEKHFYYGTNINNIDVSGKTVEESNKMIEDIINNYKLNLKERDNQDEVIKGNDIDLKFKYSEKIQAIKDKQKGLKWILNIGKNNNERVELIEYDDNKLKSILSQLEACNTQGKTHPKNPSFEYENKGYKIIDEVYGNIIKENSLYENVVYAIRDGDNELDLSEADCYEKPQYISTSEEVINTKDILDKYVATEITYNINSNTEVVNGDLIKDWIKVNDNYEITVNEDRINEYLDSLAEKYNTVGKTRNFKTTNGEYVSVSGGDYGWQIDTKEEKKYLLETISQGKVEEKEISYSQKAFTKEDDTIGNTYVEISIPSQHLWFYKNGQLIIDSSVVTGNVSAGHGTPQGTYKLDYKERNATLRGEGYSTPVSFWMPFNGGIGIHDATWRGNFGGSIYLYSGSHGCVNAPYSTANTIFNNIDQGTPIVCYY